MPLLLWLLLSSACDAIALPVVSLPLSTDAGSRLPGVVAAAL
jgi:hypothetical protein